nr:hypothetical protein [Tanacetum cinerariifolium]
KAIDDALVTHADHLEFKKCNMRLKTDINLKEATFQVMMDALTLTPFYRAFLITVDVHEDLMFHIESKDAKKKNKMSSMRCISIHEKTQVYGTILLKELTGPSMLESKAYQTYYAFTSREKAPKPKYVRKKANSDTSPKKKHVQATKAEHLKLATKISKKYFHISHASGSGDGVDTQSKVHDEQQQKTSGADEGNGTIPGVPNVPIYDFESDKESWGDSNEEDDFKDDADNNDDNYEKRTKYDRDEIPDPNLTNVDQTEHEEEKEDVDERVHTPSDYELTDDEEIHDEENINEEEEDEVTKEMYEDVNVNLGNKDIEMTNADQGASEQQNASQYGYKRELYDALVKSYNTKKDIFESYGEVFSLKSSRDDKDKDQNPSARSDRGTKRRKSSKDVVSSKDSNSKEKKPLSTSKDASQSQHMSSGKSAHAEEPSHTVEDSGMQQDHEFVTGDYDEQPVDKEDTNAD